MSRSKLSEEINQLFKAENRISKGNIQIWGGKMKEDNLQQFIGNWERSNMPFVILETVRKIIIRKNCDFSTLEPHIGDRVRIFGGSGDLDIRRDTDSFKWRYVGNEVPGDVSGENFWENKKNSDVKFFMEEKDALLWGKYNQDTDLWHEDRVAKAELSYPVEGYPERVKVRYKTLSNGGVIAFTWLLTIEEGD